MDRFGLGVLSHAHGHINTYCSVLSAAGDVRLVATWDDNEERGRGAAEQFALEYRTSPEDVVNDSNIDAVMIGVETNRHADMVELAASSGKHILLQKPMATTLADCDRIVSAVRQTGVRFSLAFQMRHDPVNRKIKELLDEDVVGNVAIVRRRHCIGVLLNPAFAQGPSKWHVDPVANIGMFFDDASHAADWFFWMLGKPRSVMAEVDNIVTNVAADDNGVALYRFERGEIGVLLNSSTTVAAVSTTEIYGDEGTIIHNYGDGPSTDVPRPESDQPLKLFRADEGHWSEFAIPLPKGHGERIAAVARPSIDYLTGESDEHVSAEEGRVSVEMILAAYRSATEGRRITFPLGDS